MTFQIRHLKQKKINVQDVIFKKFRLSSFPVNFVVYQTFLRDCSDYDLQVYLKVGRSQEKIKDRELLGSHRTF